MPIKTDAVGKTFPPVEYVVGTEKIREYAAATFDDNPLSNDEEEPRLLGLLRTRRAACSLSCSRPRPRRPSVRP